MGAHGGSFRNFPRAPSEKIVSISILLFHRKNYLNTFKYYVTPIKTTHNNAPPPRVLRYMTNDYDESLKGSLKKKMRTINDF